MYNHHTLLRYYWIPIDMTFKPKNRSTHTCGERTLSKNCTKACARDWSRAADDDEDDPWRSHPRPPPSSPDFCLSSALKSRTVAMTLRTSGLLAASAAAYPTTRFLTRHLSTFPALWLDAELISF